MRAPADAESVRAFLEALGRAGRSEARLYLTGGATAVLYGWRESTLDIDIRIDPESDDLLRAIPALKERLNVNVELASPPDFIPELPGWRERSPHVVRAGAIDVHHFDPYSQALSKVERGFDQDLEDVRSLIEHGLVEPARAVELYEAIEPELFRYPALDPASFRAKVERAFRTAT
ncbi:MAG: hypothetical protein H0V29_11550 [Thermoleophilaceae bacterium]|nr:hypothetical protein [Thermoleophilaceae bacterium]